MVRKIRTTYIYMLLSEFFIIYVLNVDSYFLIKLKLTYIFKMDENKNINIIVNTKINNYNNCIFYNFPKKVIENIFDYIDINSLLKIKYLNKKLKLLIDDYIEKHMYFSFVFKINKYDISKHFYIKVFCNKCKYFINPSCKKCMIKKCKYKFKNLKNIEIKINENYNHKKELMMKQSSVFLEIIKEIYNNSNIYNLRLVIDSYNYTTYKNKEDFEKLFRYIIKLVLNNTKNKVEILSCNEIKKEVYIKNNTLKYLIIPSTISKLRLKIPNISEIEIYGSSEENNILKFIDYVNNFSSYIKRIKINYKVLKEIKYLNKINSDLKTLSIIFNKYVNEDNIFTDLYEILSKNKMIKNIELSHINEKIVKTINNIDYIENIFIDEEFKVKKYIKKYNKVKFIDK